jgi:prolyl-tRNA editing enzyme YbaK/EbsC (Cys-tRNA(Pro) deacylase)
MDDYFWVTTRTIKDIRLAERDSVVLEAGSHEQSIRIWIPDLLRGQGRMGAAGFEPATSRV